MADETGISWADSTLNFWIGCTKVSAACDHCYAERDFDHRKHRVTWGPHGDRSPTKTWGDAKKWQREAAAFFSRHGRRRRVFVNSLSDFFDNHKSILPEWRAEAFRLMEVCADVIFMLVTKRPQNIPAMVPAHWLQPGGWPQNVWLLVTVENEQTARQRIPLLLSYFGPKVRGVSMEPLLEEVDLTAIDLDGDHEMNAFESPLWENEVAEWQDSGDPNWEAAFEEEYGVKACSTGPMHATLDLVLAGGESGPDARPSHPEWFRKLRDECAAAGAVFHFKQWGEFVPGGHPAVPMPKSLMSMDHMVDSGAFPDGQVMVDVGKKAAGRLLDGVLHDEMPV